MPDILIIPQRGTSNNPSMHFTGSGLANIKMEVLPSGSIAFIGTSGSLFNITDSLIGSLMAVGDVSGLPILEVFSDDRVVMGKYGKNTVYVSGTNVGIGKVPLNAVLDVSGSMAVSGSVALNSTLNVASSLNLLGGNGNQLNGNGSTLSLSISGNWNSNVSSLIQLTSTDLNFWTNGGSFRFKNSSGTDIATLTNAGKLSILNGGTGTTNAPLQVAGDIVTYRTSTSGVIYFGTDGNRYLYYDGSNYYMPSGQLYVNAVQVVTNTGTWGISVTGNATSETLSTVTSRGATTAYQIAVSTSAGGSMVTGTKAGGSYGDGVSGATFKSILDNTNGGAAYAFASYYGGSSGTLGASIRADGTTYISNTLGVGTTSPSTKIEAYQTSNDTIIQSKSTTAGAWFYADSAADGYFGLDLRVSGTSKWFIGQNTGGTQLSIRRTGTEVFTILSTGNVGIGTSPSYKLDVNGNSNITGNLTVSGTITGTIAASTVDFTPNFMLMGA
jgi:hypothetical protein